MKPLLENKDNPLNSLSQIEKCKIIQSGLNIKSEGKQYRPNYETDNK